MPLAAQDISINLGQGAATGAPERANHPACRAVDGAVAGAIDPRDDDLVYAHRGVLSPLRAALGTTTLPPNSVVMSLALFLTAFAKGPVLTRVYDVGVKPLVANEINLTEAFDRASSPLRGFKEKNVREKDLCLFVDMSGEKAPQKPEDLSMRILVPAS